MYINLSQKHKQYLENANRPLQSVLITLRSFDQVLTRAQVWFRPPSLGRGWGRPQGDPQLTLAWYHWMHLIIRNNKIWFRGGDLNSSWDIWPFMKWERRASFRAPFDLQNFISISVIFLFWTICPVVTEKSSGQNLDGLWHAPKGAFESVILNFGTLFPYLSYPQIS